MLACNPFGGDDEAENAADSPQLVEVGLDRPDAADSPSSQPATLASQEEQPPAATTEPAPTAEAASSPEEPAEQPAATPALEVPSEEAVERVWAFLSQCVSVGIDELVAEQIDGEWYVQAAAESPGRYGIWKVDLPTGSVQPHNIHARQWGPQINPQCTKEEFADFYLPTPTPRIDTRVTDAGQAVTSLWATLVKCYPSISTDDLQATPNPARAEWIVTAREGVTTNFGVWAVRSNGEVVPFNRQAEGVYGQLDSGLC